MALYHTRRRFPRTILAVVIAFALLLFGLIGVLVVRTPSHPGGAGRNHAPTKRDGVLPLTVESVSPSANATNVGGTSQISVRFSTAIAPNSPMPTLSPQYPGAWRVAGNTAAFSPSGAFVPLSVISLNIPGGHLGIRGRNGGELANNFSEHFRVQNGSVLRLQELLSLLDYSPLRWSPSGEPISSTDTNAQLSAFFNPPQGVFTWSDSRWPATLRALWSPGEYNVFTKGLVMSFQADHDLTPNGHRGPQLWRALLQAVASNAVNTGGYDYALANKSTPETLVIWHNGHAILRSSMNSGISASPTPDGTFPVYTRLRRQIMQGTNPNGAHYADLVQYIAYFHGNDAVHYMDRADYGIPQSLGCIELPLADAAKAWPYLAYGTLVTIEH